MAEAVTLAGAVAEAFTVEAEATPEEAVFTAVTRVVDTTAGAVIPAAVDTMAEAIPAVVAIMVVTVEAQVLTAGAARTAECAENRAAQLGLGPPKATAFETPHPDGIRFNDPPERRACQRGPVPQV